MDPKKIFYKDIETTTTKVTRNEEGEVIGLKIDDEEEPCLIRAFFESEQKKPPAQRQTSCMISCPCSRCTPYSL